LKKREKKGGKVGKKIQKKQECTVDYYCILVVGKQ
jgi:hypothetical protein